MRLVIASLLAALTPIGMAFAITTNTVTFQKGDANGYSGISELMISDAGAPNDGKDGSTVQSWSVDGYSPEDPNTPAIEFSPDQPSLTKWDNIIGSGVTQIPQGATILSAQLSLKTTNGAAAASVGPWSLASLNAPFTSATRYADFPSGDPLGFRGPWWQDGYTARPINGYSRVANITVYPANIAPLVQQWANNPASNNGYVMQSGFTGTNDAWSYDTSGDAVQADRPKLTVTYTTSPVVTNTIQRGLNGYTGVTTAWVRSGVVQSVDATHPDASVDDITYDGFTGTATVSATNPNQTPAALTSFQQFVDGPAFNLDGTLSSPDDFALLKFNNVFGSGAGQAPADKAVAKAWLVITTGDSSGNARSADKWDVYPMQRDWTTTSLYSTGFGAAPGLTAADGDIPATSLDEQIGMTTGSEVRFDVTSYLEAIRNGAADHGLAILHGLDATDGWQLWFDGAPDATLSPRLVIVSDMSAAGVAGDYNNDGKVDMRDYVAWRDGQSPTPNSVADYNTWRANFGAGAGAGSGLGGGAAVPEPTALLLSLVASLGLCLCSSRNR